MARAKEVIPRRGDVYLVRLDPTVGVEIKKTRPAIVVQNDISNRAGASTIVVPITSRTREEIYPNEAIIPEGESGLRIESIALARQIRVVDRKRLVHRIGAVSKETMSALDQAILITLGLIDF